jgi:hypothetical protein
LQVRVLREVVWGVVGGEGIGEMCRRYGSLRVVRELATEDEYLFL